MTTAVVDSPENEQAQAWWFLDTLVVEHRCAPEMDTVVLEMTLPVGSAPPLHVHDDLDDTWYILEGQMVVRCGDDELVVGAGHWVSMPRGVPHTFRVVGEREARILLVHDNASFRDLIRDLSTPATARVVPSHPTFPPMDELARIAASHDLRPIGPPMSAEDSDTVLVDRKLIRLGQLSTFLPGRANPTPGGSEKCSSRATCSMVSEIREWPRPSVGRSLTWPNGS